MKKWWFAFLVIVSAITLAENGVCATYDATGAWDFTDYDHWNNCGDPDPGTEQGTLIIIQKDNTFTLIFDDTTVTGTVNGNVYTAQVEFYEDGGWVTGTATVTFSSSTQASGTVNWTWSGSGQTCSGGQQISWSKKQQIPPNYDATGKWDYSESGLWNNCTTVRESARSCSTWASSGQGATARQAVIYAC